MFFNGSKVLIALAAATVVTASPTRRDWTVETTTCSFILHANGPFDSSELLAEFNYAIGRTLAMAVPSHSIDGGGDATWVDNGDNTFDVQLTIGAVGETSASAAAIMTGWVGTSLVGPTVNWFVQSASCI
ncbi:hypothetical protein BDZ94DRAFT_1265567 [Collybia nuda]|uniref:Uncharacterized protein n=1 Tax=Collybia nuda TaxID=64659 RepID=A0A9P5Y3S2_9AGAR|nr:hypothetical protein BDZ94DRAFT_1265567 [Collybia nuda]